MTHDEPRVAMAVVFLASGVDSRVVEHLERERGEKEREKKEEREPGKGKSGTRPAA